MIKDDHHIPATQTAVQLTAPDEMCVTDRKQVLAPGPYQVLCKTEAVGLCFSDLKLLKQFDSHPRKGEVVSGLDDETLREIPSYVPGKSPAVPGHETVVRVCALGEKVKHIKTNQRYLVQSDYRWIRTANSCAAFGYNFEGGLQEYVLLDERVCTSPQGESMMIPAGDELSASAVALVEPWACVEHAYVTEDRRAIKTEGQMLVVADVEIDPQTFSIFLKRYGTSREITACDKAASLSELNIPLRILSSIEQAKGSAFDDVIYFGSNVQRAQALFHKVAANGLYNIVQCGGKFAKEVTTPIGRIHYESIRLIGTTASDPSRSMERIPQSGEIRAGDKINIIGAAGPMGTMHVIRAVTSKIQGVEVFGSDLDDERLQVLHRLAQPIAQKNGVRFQAYHSKREQLDLEFNYIVLMVPSAPLAAETLHTAASGAIINLFAGIPA
ncbi:MAG: alcohol dehydrogenase catalytic domain-containing protein [Planctomycetes bacterium]|nr:alcohol dehydrogenase catalytic domain-containing protein [Planctomycetota bacterium]